MDQEVKVISIKYSGSPPSRVHFAGIGGVGMAGLAFIMKKSGYAVSGCDIAPNDLFKWLNASEIETFNSHSPGHIDCLNKTTDMLVRTQAVSGNDPEIQHAKELGVPILSRGELLAEITGELPSIIVCGSHGKTTTSCLIAGAMKKLSPDNIAWCIGGVSPYLGAVAGLKQNKPAQPMLIAEADESDGTLSLYHPQITVLTNLDFDHIEHFRDAAEFEQVFRAVLSNTSEAIVYCADHPKASAIAREQINKMLVSFGFNESADFRAVDISLSSAGSEFILKVSPTSKIFPGEHIKVSLPVPGAHNILNASAAIAAVCAAGYSLSDAVEAIKSTAVLPARRFEHIPSISGITVISDYSHHPEEIKALIDTAKILNPKRIIAVFQPHRYSRTKTLLNEFPPAFKGIDILVLAPVYAASEQTIEGGTSAGLYRSFRKAAENNYEIPVPILASSLSNAEKYVCTTMRSGDVILVIGAGDINTIAPQIANTKIDELPSSEMALGVFGTSAPVSSFETITTIEELSKTVKRSMPKVIAAGTKILLAPTGFYSPLIKLSGAEFNFIRQISNGGESETEIIEAGAATPGAKLLQYCEDSGLSGLEFMVGIPGHCGGWAAMNAGTRYGEFCDAIESVTVMNSNAEIAAISKESLNCSYRSCAALKENIMISVRVKLTKSTSGDVYNRMREFAKLRMDFSGLRTAGSIFKNPPNPLPSAGKLLEEAECKGLHIGGAYVTCEHANVIATDKFATSSDITALISILQDRIYKTTQIELIPELQILE